MSVADSNDLAEQITERPPNNDGSEHDDVQRALEVFGRVARRALRQPDVAGVDIGYMIKWDSIEDTVGIRLHVAAKLPPAQLAALGRPDFDSADDLESLFPGMKIQTVGQDGEKKKDGRATLDGVPIDIVEGQFSPFQSCPASIRSRRPRSSIEMSDSEIRGSARERIDPLVGGLSIGNDSGSTGSVGLVVHDRTDGRPCILSNWHVLAGFGETQRGRPCYQPSFFDGGSEADRAGRLKRWIFDRRGDAALAELDPNRGYSAGSILGLWFPINDILRPWLGMKVMKSGRSTGFTEGFVDGVNMMTNIPYGQVTPRRFEGQIHIAPRFSGDVFSDPGDSGSVIVTDLPVTYRPGRAEKGKGDAEQLKAHRLPAGPSVHGLHNVSNGEAKEWRESWEGSRSLMRVYFAVGLLFAGDTAASTFGEFALATPMVDLAESLDFSIHPVFVPESDQMPQVQARDAGRNTSTSAGGGAPARQIGPGAGAQVTIGGPQPGSDPIPPDQGP